jgi:DNA-binding transcriptional MerR regulator
MADLRMNGFRKLMLAKGFDFSESKLRQYGLVGLLPCIVNNVGQRIFDEKNVPIAIRNILLYELGVSASDIRDNNKEVIKDKLQAVEDVVKKFF